MITTRLARNACCVVATMMFASSHWAHSAAQETVTAWFEPSGDNDIEFASVVDDFSFDCLSVEASSDEGFPSARLVAYESPIVKTAFRLSTKPSLDPQTSASAMRPEFPESSSRRIGLIHDGSTDPAAPVTLIETPISANPLVGDCGCQHSCDCGQSDRPRGKTRIERFLNGVYHGICHPDPCYQPEWTMLANAGLFTDALRPQNRQRFRWDFSNDYGLPDRAEYLWGRSGVKGPSFENSIDFHQLSYYLETGGDRFSFFVNTPYRSNYLNSGGHTAGFADLSTGTKTLLHDTDLLQVALQFETHIPSGNFLKGLGTGHVALEPALLFGVQLSRCSYLQTQISHWIPIGGTPEFAGSLTRYAASYNRTLLGRVDNTSLIGTLEYSGVSFQAGGVSTGPGAPGPAISTNEVNFAMLGSGLRLNICNKFNIGFGTQVGLNDDSPSAMYRTEIQFRH